jgi:glutamyl-Q tRNA(Asp) synthetase
MRVRTDNAQIAFTDGLQGLQQQRLESESGDFVIWRRDGLVAYHLAVVVDDFEQGISEIVRGIDLIDSTQRQIWLQRLLGYPQPDYLHIPVATHADGQKLSKLTGAPAVSLKAVESILMQAMVALGQHPPEALQGASLADIWRWAISNWKIESLLGVAEIGVDCSAMADGQNGIL